MKLRLLWLWLCSADDSRWRHRARPAWSPQSLTRKWGRTPLTPLRSLQRWRSDAAAPGRLIGRRYPRWWGSSRTSGRRPLGPLRRTRSCGSLSQRPVKALALPARPPATARPTSATPSPPVDPPSFLLSLRPQKERLLLLVCTLLGCSGQEAPPICRLVKIRGFKGSCRWVDFLIDFFTENMCISKNSSISWSSFSPLFLWTGEVGGCPVRASRKRFYRPFDGTTKRTKSLPVCRHHRDEANIFSILQNNDTKIVKIHLPPSF